MNTKQKLGIGILVAALVFLFFGHKALAANYNFSGATYTVTSDTSDDKEITVTLADGTTINFKDSSPGDDIHNYKPTDDSGDWCPNTKYDGSGNNDPSKGITIIPL